MIQILETFIIATAGVFISWQQWRIAEIRLRHDMYERQFKVYQAAKTLLVAFQDNAVISGEEYIKFVRGITDAEFLFHDPDVIRYLQTIRENATELMHLEKAKDAEDKYAEMSNWFMNQFDVLKSKFMPSMRLRPLTMAERFKYLLHTRAS